VSHGDGTSPARSKHGRRSLPSPRNSLALARVDERILGVPSLNLAQYRSLDLPGGFVLSSVELVPGPLIDPIGRPALAKTTIQGRDIRIILDETRPAVEQSISIYHEVLEGMTVAFAHPPTAVLEF
jgi:hypothetical protein